jgi:hypothetical protein
MRVITMNQTTGVMRTLHSNSTNSVSPLLFVPRIAKHITAGAIALGLLFVAVTKSQAQALTNYYWTGADNNGVWEDGNNWIISNSVATSFWPGEENDGISDAAFFTNSGTYSVSLTSGGTDTIYSNVFDCSSGGVAVVTMTLNGSTGLFIPAGAFDVAEGSNETTTVYLGSSPSPNGLLLEGTEAVGHDGIGTLILTNGFIQTTTPVNIGNGSGQGTIIITGPNTVWEAYQFAIGGTNTSYGDSLIVSNSASLTISSTFRIGSSSTVGSSNCLFAVTDGAVVSVTGGSPVTIGMRGGSLSAGASAYNNVANIKVGGAIDIVDHSIVVGNSATLQSGIACSSCIAAGTTATGNTLIVQSGGIVTNATQIAITTSNTFALYGGIFGGGPGNGTTVYLGNITNFGVFQGWGVLIGSLNNSSNVTYGALGYIATSNQVGALVLSNSFTTASNTVMQIALGTNYNPIAVGLGQDDPPGNLLSMSNSLVLYGTINFVNSGGFTAPNTYTLFTYPPALVTNYSSGLVNSNRFIIDPVIGSVPNPAYTYQITTNTPGQINLIVGCTNCSSALPFKITSITRTNSGVDGNNDILVKWNTTGTNNHLQVTSGTANGSFSTNAFANLANYAVTTTTTNYVDVGGATNNPARYYRISSP